jgi:hypothetical protein
MLRRRQKRDLTIRIGDKVRRYNDISQPWRVVALGEWFARPGHPTNAPRGRHITLENLLTGERCEDMNLGVFHPIPNAVYENDNR